MLWLFPKVESHCLMLRIFCGIRVGLLTMKPAQDQDGLVSCTMKSTPFHHLLLLECLFLLIECNANNHSCIYCSLLFICQQSASLQMPMPCVTFDQLVCGWQPGIDLIHSQNVNVVHRLGPFHTMMSFSGSISTVMAGSGLPELLQCCFGYNTVSQMLAGKAAKRTACGHILL